MTDTATTAPAPPMSVVLEASEGFAPRTRKSTSDALSALKPSLDAVRQSPDKVYTIAKGVTPQRAASLVSLLNERYPNTWTFGGRSTGDGTAIVQARYSTKPELQRPVRRSTPRAAKPTATAKKGGK